MNVTDYVGRLVHSWVTAVIAIVGLLSTVWNPAAAIVTVFWANLGTIFPAVSVVASTLAPQLAWLDATAVQSLVFVVGVLYVAKLGDRVVDAYQDKL